MIDPDFSVPNELNARDRALRYIAEALVLDLLAPVSEGAQNGDGARE